MRPDDNWKEVRLLAEDLDTLLGLPKEVSEDYLKILENLIVHRFIETISNEDFRGKDCQVELPYLGSLVVSVDESDKLSLNFIPRSTFYRKIKNAYYKRESPLVTQCAEILGQDLVKKYEEGGE